MNQLGITNNRQQTEPSCFISMKLVESAFEYQKEIMELKQQKALKSKMEEIGPDLVVVVVHTLLR